MKISTHKFVSLSYDLTSGDGAEEDDLRERATAENPMEFVFGTGTMLEAFENKLEGLSQGEEFEFTISPEDGHGEYVEEKVMDLPRSIFEQDGKINEEIVFEGNQVPMMTSDGQRLDGFILAVKDDVITVDFNHPLAGEELKFKGKVLAVREATAEEIMALTMPQEGGCGCGGNCGCSDDETEGCGDGCGCGSQKEEQHSCGCGCGH